MKQETRLEKLNKLLGISAKVAEVTTKKTGRVVGLTEDEIQEFREIQGVIYFLQAPALFSAKVCKHCGEQFLVSRKYVAFCSYTCIRKDLEDKGIKWSKGHDLEALTNDPQVYEGNEPIWIRKRVLEKLQEVLTLQQDQTETSTTPSVTPSMSVPESTGTSSMETKSTSLPVPSTTSPLKIAGPGKRLSTKSGVKRKFT